MCGIAGILFPREPGASLEKRLDLMNDSQAHRGPDERGKVILPGAGLAHTRLSLLDAEGGKQPMQDPTGRYHLVLNGQIYNHRELREALSSRYRFRTRSDTEVLLAAYAVHGEDCLDLLDGMFAFCVWDAERREAFLARDALGVKPLVFADCGGELIFASECKAILGVWDRATRVNESALVEFVVVPALSGVREPMFQGMEYLQAGWKLRVSRSGTRKERWFRYRVGGRNGSSPEPEALRSALERSVDATLGADFPVGTLLSGGVDSSLITTLACRNGHCREGPLHSYNIRFDSHQELDFNDSSIVISDDAPFAESLATTLPLDFHKVHVSRDTILDAVQPLARIDDRVPAWEQELSQYFLAEAASRSCKAVLVGDAADETHFGYFFLLQEDVSHGPRGLMDLFGAERRMACLSPRLRRLYDPLVELDVQYRRLVEEAGYRFGEDTEGNIQAMTYLVVTLWLGRLLHNGDIQTMAHGLEARVPFANREVLAVAQAVPPTLGYHGRTEKYLLRQAASGCLPRDICWRKKSALPRDPRLGRQYQRRLAELLDAHPSFVESTLDRAEVERLCRAPVLTENERILAFNLISLIHWGETHHV